MANITTNTLFPSAKFISTDALGDLQEAVGANAVKAKYIYNGITAEAVTAGDAGNDIAIEYSFIDDASATAKSVAWSLIAGVNTCEITYNSQGIFAELVDDSGLTFTAQNAGVSGNNISVELIDNQSGNGVVGVEFSTPVNSDSIVISTELALDQYTQGDIVNALASATQSIQDHISVTASDSLAQLGASDVFGATSLTGGVDAVPASSVVQSDITNAFASAPVEITDAIVVTNETPSASFATPLSHTNLAGGADEVAGQLDPLSDYVLIKQSDIYDLEASETNDARKMLWGIVHNASEVWAQQATQPDSLQISRSAVSSTDGGLALKQTYTITAKYAISGLDLKAEV